MKQYRRTRQRQMVLDAVSQRCDHPSAGQIYSEVREKDGKISRGTVYRNLKLLAENGEIIDVKVSNADRFDCRMDFHHHLLCTRCGEVSDAPIEYVGMLDREIAEKTGYTIDRHRTVFEGICPECLKDSGGK